MTIRERRYQDEAPIDRWLGAWADEHDTMIFIGTTGRTYVLMTKGDREFAYLQEIAPTPERAATILHRHNIVCHRE